MSLPSPDGRIVVPTDQLGEFLNNLDGLSLPEWLKLGELGLTIESLIQGDANEAVVPWAAWVWARRNVEPGLPWGSDRVFIPLASS
jgi:hypothetical protein